MSDTNALSLLTILYVEDEDLTRDELSRFLKRRVSHLETARNGLEALTLFEKHTPDVLITDLRMPDMDGLELTGRIRDLGFDTPIIITSALSDSETILTAVDRGIVKYIVKPIDAEELETALYSVAEDILSRRHKFVADRRILSADDRQQIEKLLSRDISALLKKSTGKGPRKLRVKISIESVQIIVEGMLTPMEQTLLRGAQSPEALAMNRELLYKTLESEIHDMFTKHTGCGIHMSQYAGRIREDKEEIYLTFKRR